MNNVNLNGMKIVNRKESLMKLLQDLYHDFKLQISLIGCPWFATNDQQEEFKELQVGDVYYCNMPRKTKELRKIEESHRIRPYLCLKKGKNYFYGIPATSNKLTHWNYFRKFAYFDQEGIDKRESTLQLTHIEKIPMDHLLDFHRMLSEEILNRIYKRYHILKNLNIYDVKKITLKPIPYERYDIVAFDNRWYMVLEQHESGYECLPLNRIKINSPKPGIKVEGLDRRVFPSSNSHVQIEAEAMKLIGFLRSEEIDLMESYLHPVKKKNNIKRSNIFFVFPTCHIVREPISENIYVYLYSRKKKKKTVHRYYPYIIEDDSYLGDSESWELVSHVINPEVIGRLNLEEVEEMMGEFNNPHKEEIMKEFKKTLTIEQNGKENIYEKRKTIQ